MVTLTGALWCNLVIAVLEMILVLSMLLFSNIGMADTVRQAGEQSLRYCNARVICVLYLCIASANCVAWLESEEHR